MYLQFIILIYICFYYHSGKKACIKQELVDIVVKEEPIDFEEEKIHPVVPPLIIKTEYIKNSKKKHSKKHKDDGSSKKSRKESKVYVAEIATKVSKKSKKEIKSEEFIQETISSNNDSTSTKLPGKLFYFILYLI